MTRWSGGSLRLRLLAGSLVWILGALTVTGFVLADLFGQHVTARFEDELRGHLDQLTGNLELGTGGVPRLRAEPSDPRLSKPYSGLYWQIDSPREVGRLRSRSLWDTVLSVPVDAPADGQVHVHRVAGPDGSNLVTMERLVYPAQRPDRPQRLIVAADERGITGPVREFVGLMATALVLLGAGLVLAVVAQVAVGLAPLRRLREALAGVRDGRTRRLDGRFPREVQPLVDELNGLLQHDAEAVARARTQAGNLAHAVKTPLTVLSNAAAGEDGPLARLVTEQVANALRQVDHHLARARAAAATRLPGLQAPVRPALEGVMRVMRRLYAERGLSIDLSAPLNRFAFRGEEQDLHEMLGNLLDNACKWARSRVAVEAGVDQGRVLVVVDDDGPGLSPENRERVFARGERADERVPGSGLGLAIVRDLAELYGGEVELLQSPLGGLRARLVLPATE